MRTGVLRNMNMWSLDMVSESTLTQGSIFFLNHTRIPSEALDFFGNETRTIPLLPVILSIPHNVKDATQIFTKTGPSHGTLNQ